MFNKISIRLRKKSVDVQVEDIESGSKRRRVFRCSDWTRVEHFITYRTLTDGIEELEPRTLKSRVPKKTVGKKPVNKPTAKKRGKQPMSKEDVRHVMEKEGIPNAVIPTPAKKMYDKDSAKEQAAINRSRTKAEKVIIKICSPGGPFADAKNGGLIKALEENGFDSNVAFYAAMNCGRITDPSIIKRHEAKNKKTTEAHSNQY